MCYYQSPNRILAESLPGEQPKPIPAADASVSRRLGYPHVLCCVGTVNRIVPNYIMHMWMATPRPRPGGDAVRPLPVSALVGGRIPREVDLRDGLSV